MKHLASWLTVALLGCVPLTAAALDYGPNRPLLAAESGAPRLPSLQQRDASGAGMSKPDIMAATEAPDTSPATHRMTPSASASTPATRGPTANAKSRATPVPPAAEPGPATWQSLLPGSIQ